MEDPVAGDGLETEQWNYTDVIQRAQAMVNDAKFPDAERWNESLQGGCPYSSVTIFFFQLHHLKSLRLDYSFVWISRGPNLTLRHALFFCSFNYLSMVDYGGNVRRSEFIE